MKKFFELQIGPIITEIDNMATMITAKTNKISARYRHFLMREETVREAIQNGFIKLNYTPTDKCRADGLTKALQHTKHTNFCKQIMLDLKHSV